ncbi:MAG: DUF928 domain-containing protein [Nitrospira sp.]|nr:DUF928 domain-containing protein [Nitrospira sp.]
MDRVSLELEFGLHDQHGLTVQKSPSLYFYHDGLGAWSQFISVRFILTDGRSGQPLAELPLQLSGYPGLQRINLADYGIELKSETRYQWSISGIVNWELALSKEITGPMLGAMLRVAMVAGGDIVRISPKYLDDYGGPCTHDHVRVLRKAGLWYDAFDCANELIEASPDGMDLRDMRDELLGRCRAPYDRMPLLGCWNREWNWLE